MASFRRPSDDRVRAFLDSQRYAPYSYGAVGATAHDPPKGFNVDRHAVRLGSGDSCFERAVAAMRAWQMFDLGWVRIRPDVPPIDRNVVVAIVVRYAGVWFLNAARIVYVLDEVAPVRRFGFAYGTLLAHAETGEERFTIERREDGSVWYELFAFSRPRLWLARAGYPLGRGLQKRFARDSMAAMGELV